jgi:cell wall-associated NlpC family hydrolase
MNPKLLYDYATAFLGKPYIWGGDNPVEGFDCSGFCLELLRSQGAWDRSDDTAQGIYNRFKERPVKSLGIGAFAFYGKSRISHVAMLIDGVHIIEAGGGGSRTKTDKDAAAQDAFIRIRPLNHRSDLVAVL